MVSNSVFSNYQLKIFRVCVIKGSCSVNQQRTVPCGKWLSDCGHVLVLCRAKRSHASVLAASLTHGEKGHFIFLVPKLCSAVGTWWFNSSRAF